MLEHLTEITDVLIIGSGGAGLRAAIEVKQLGLQVTILGKREKNDPHTVLAAGGINAALGNLDKKDSWEIHFADTFLEGYGIGDPELIETMAREAPQIVKEIDSWGASLQRLSNGQIDQRYFGAHTYRRTCYAGDYTGQAILESLLKKSKSLNIPIYDAQFVTDLLIEENRCFGAISINKSNGEKVVHFADAVILCTGGHTRLWKNSTSRENENTGDGLHLALKAGCEIKDMEMVQFHPTGMIHPDEFIGTLVTEAVRGEGGILRNGNGERFMNKYDEKRMELSTRDKVAIANYKEIKEGRMSPNGGVFLDISHKNKDHIIKKLPKIYKQFLDYQNLDISKYPMEVAPTAHYSMGGIAVNNKEHNTNILGLFAAGEVAGGLHGANRLGGNSLAEILIFGKITGAAASKYSKNQKVKDINKNKIKNILCDIDKYIKKGSESSINLQSELRKVMWNYCGVIKDKSNLDKGLKKVLDIEKSIDDIDVRISSNNYQDLFNLFELNSSLVTAKATLISSLQRKESRGAHQRSDFPKLNKFENCNYFIRYKNKELEFYKKDIPKLDNRLVKIINKTKKINDFKGRLLE